MPRPDQERPVVFDLVETGGQDAAAPTGAAPTGDVRPRAELLSRIPRLPRRTVLVAAAVVAAVLASITVVDLVRDHRRAELMRTSSIGVASLAERPSTTWTVPFDSPGGADQGLSLGQQVVTMGDLLVVPPASAQDFWVDASTGAAEPRPVGFEDVVAIDPGSGEVAWRVPLGERPACGPTGFDASTAVDTLVCVHGPDDAREVLTIGPDGSTRARSADLAAGEQLFAGPDGTVVRTVRTGKPVGTVECDSSGDCPPEGLAEGRDLLVTAEDAVTGAERWTSTVEFDQTAGYSCQVMSSSADWSTTEPTVDPDLVTVRAGARSVVVDGCGVVATFSPRGVRLDLAGGLQSPAWVSELGPGRYTVSGNGTATVVVDDTGKIVRRVDGMLHTGPTSPDAPDDVQYVTRPSGSGFAMLREDGSVAWTERYGQSVLLAGRDVVVVDRGARLVGLDRATGAELWGFESEEPASSVRLRTVTDGETLAVQYLPVSGSGQGLLVALDLSTGERLWDVPMTGSVVAVDGHLVEFTPEAVRGLG